MKCLQVGSVVACEVVWAEVATAYGHSIKELMEALNSIHLRFSAMTIEASLESARRWYAYRRKVGKKKRIVADFF